MRENFLFDSVKWFEALLVFGPVYYSCVVYTQFSACFICMMIFRERSSNVMRSECPAVWSLGVIGLTQNLRESPKHQRKRLKNLQILFWPWYDLSLFFFFYVGWHWVWLLKKKTAWLKRKQSFSSVNRIFIYLSKFKLRSVSCALELWLHHIRTRYCEADRAT